MEKIKVIIPNGTYSFEPFTGFRYGKKRKKRDPMNIVVYRFKFLKENYASVKFPFGMKHLYSKRYR